MLKTLDDINGEPTRVLLHGPLGDMFGREHSLYISSPAEAVRALCAIKKGFRGELARPGAFYSVLLGASGAADSTPDASGADSTPDASGAADSTPDAAPLPLEGLGLCSAGRDVHIVPVLEGAKSQNAVNGWFIAAGVALLAVAFVASGGIAAFAVGGINAAWTGMNATFLGSIATTAGMYMVVTGVHGLLTASDTDKPKDVRDPSRLFNGPVNTIAQGHPIQICYGEMEIGSALIASMIDYTLVAPGYRDMNTVDDEDDDGDGNGPGNGAGNGAGNGPSDIIIAPPTFT
jgi:predicted phage tail protein